MEFKTVEEARFVKAKLLTDPLFFTRYFFKCQYSRKFVIGEHHKIICDKLKDVFSGKSKRVIINMPPRYGKTELFVKTFMGMGMAINPKSKFIHTSYSDSLALDNSETVKNLIESDEFRMFFDIKIKVDSHSKKKWYNENLGGVYATSAGGQITGFGAGLVEEENELNEFLEGYNNEDFSSFGGAFIIDDPLKPEDARSTTKRDLVNERFDSTFRSRVNSDKTPIIIVMQRVHEWDLTGYLLSKEPDEWEVISLPAIKENGQPLWPFKHSVEQLNHLMRLNNYVFQTQYQQRTVQLKSGGEYLKQFEVEKHVKSVSYEPATPLYISIDQNVNPYITATIWQLVGKRLTQHDEILCRTPRNTAEKAAMDVLYKLKEIEFKDVIYLTGDATTQAKNAISEATFYDIFYMILSKEYEVVKKIPASNPSVALRGAFINSVLEMNYDGCEIVIGENCKESICDYIETKENADGTIKKERVTQGGISFEKGGHIVDTLCYTVCQSFNDSYRNYTNKSKGFEYVLPPRADRSY